VCRKITKEDIFIKARMLAEGVRIQDRKSPPEAGALDDSELEGIDRMAVDDPEGLLRKLADANRAEATDSALGNAVLLEGCGIPAPILPNEESRLHLTMEGEKVILSEQGDVLATGDFYTPHRPWSGEVLSNGMPVESVLPGMSSSIVNILVTLSCNNFNTGRGCRFCGLFANPVSRRLNELPISTLAQWSGYQAEAVKILTDHGWRGILAISGGALQPSRKEEHLARLEKVINPIREILDEKMADCYLRHGAKFIKAVASELFADVYHHHAPGFIKAMGLYNGECGPSMFSGSIQTTHLTVVFNEILRRAQKIPGVTSRLKIEVA